MSDPVGHPHLFLGAAHERNERRTRWVIALTLVTMVVEIAAGTAFGSMALLADGWHMATHAGALGVAAFAYAFARRRAADPRFPRSSPSRRCWPGDWAGGRGSIRRSACWAR